MNGTEFLLQALHKMNFVDEVALAQSKNRVKQARRALRDFDALSFEAQRLLYDDYCQGLAAQLKRRDETLACLATASLILQDADLPGWVREGLSEGLKSCCWELGGHKPYPAWERWYRATLVQAVNDAVNIRAELVARDRLKQKCREEIHARGERYESR